jgi:GT2 family glycosyltransferase
MDGYIEHLDTRNFAIKADLMKEIMFDPSIATCEDFDFFLRLRTRSSSRIRFAPFVRIKHYHDASAKELFMTQYSRAFAVEKILEAHRQDPEIRRYLANNEIESGLTAKGFLLFPFWIARQIVFSPIRATYAIVAESAWKFGVLASALRPGRPA